MFILDKIRSMCFNTEYRREGNSEIYNNFQFLLINLFHLFWAPRDVFII